METVDAWIIASVCLVILLFTHFRTANAIHSTHAAVIVQNVLIMKKLGIPDSDIAFVTTNDFLKAKNQE